MKYITREGDVLDWICWKYYGTTGALVVETVLTSNLGLADYGPILPLGLEINLPDIIIPRQTNGIRLWD